MAGDKNNNSSKSRRLEWKWIVIMGGILSRIVTTGTVSCIGVFFDDIKGSFPNATTAQLSVVFSIAPGLLEGTGVLATFLLAIIKARYLVIIGSVIATGGILMASQATNYFVLLLGFGIMNGIGQGLARCLLPIAITFSFNEKTRHIAFAILNGGDGVGGILGPILFTYLIELFTWRNALFVVAGLTANLAVSGCSIPLTLTTTNVRREKIASKQSVAEAKDIDSNTIVPADFKRSISARSEFEEPDVPLFPNLIFFYSNILTHSVAYFIFMTFIFSDMKEHNMSPDVVSLIVAIIGGVSILGRISIGIMDNKRVPRWVIYMSGHLIRSLVVLCFNIPLSDDGQTRIIVYGILCALYGLTDGVTGSLIPLICVDLFGLKNFGLVLGWEMFLMGLGAIVGVPLGGAMRDAFNSFQIPFLFAAFSFMFAGLILVPLFWTKKRYQMVAFLLDKKSRLAERKYSL